MCVATTWAAQPIDSVKSTLRNGHNRFRTLQKYKIYILNNVTRKYVVFEIISETLFIDAKSNLPGGIQFLLRTMVARYTSLEVGNTQNIYTSTHYYLHQRATFRDIIFVLASHMTYKTRMILQCFAFYSSSEPS